MGKQFLYFLFLPFILSGCLSSTHYTPFLNKETTRPVVAFVPVFDTSHSKLPWSLAQEFTTSMRERFLKSGALHLLPEKEVSRLCEDLTDKNNPFHPKADWVKETFQGCEFVIFAEMLEHDIHPKSVSDTLLDRFVSSAELSLSMRLRVFDLRTLKSSVILQEIIHQDHTIPLPFDLSKEKGDYFSTITFKLSPLGFAHGDLTREVTARIEDYILLTQSTLKP